MPSETPLGTIAPSYHENVSQEQKDIALVEPHELQLPPSLSSRCGEDSGDVSRNAESDSSTLRYDSSSATPQYDRILKSSSTWPTPAWGTSSQATSSSMQNYDLCSSDENFCISRRALQNDSVSKFDNGSMSTGNTSTVQTGSFVNMSHDSDYVNLRQKPQEVLHWYRTERISEEQDEWEVVEVGLDGMMDGATDTKTLEVIGYLWQ
ncbi:hypothetical protein BGX38DRAFT_1147719 [Terfezia claveryi]|nr:hypothetical protein BGX38DRAFT_1147719 [Terfezia claveryi]